MRVSRIYHSEPLTLGATTTLSEFAFQHAIKSLRCKVGDLLVLFDGTGWDYTAEIVEIQRRSAQLIIQQRNAAIQESPLHTILLQGVSKPERMDWAIQKATELGVNEIIPIITQHSDPIKQLEKKAEHWQKVIIHACEQSFRGVLPILHPAQTLGAALSSVEAEAKMLMSLTSSSQQLPSKAKSAAMLVGPIAGFTDQEEAAAIEAGFVPLHLSDRVLRTETAAAVGLTLCQYHWGDFAHG